MAKNPGIKFEERVLGHLKPYYPEAQRRKGSGSVHGMGDVVAGPFEIECKDNPDQKSISIVEKDWRHTARAARSEGRIPLFVNHNTLGEFVTLRLTDFIDLLESSIRGEQLKARVAELENQREGAT